MLTKCGRNYEITEEDQIAWQRTYPNIDVYAELNAIESWLNTNKAKRKRMSQMKSWINNWLLKASKVQRENGYGSPQAKEFRSTLRGKPIEASLSDVSWVEDIESRLAAKQFYLDSKGYYWDKSFKGRGGIEVDGTTITQEIISRKQSEVDFGKPLLSERIGSSSEHNLTEDEFEVISYLRG